jgi:hypothetical protein
MCRGMPFRLWGTCGGGPGTRTCGIFVGLAENIYRPVQAAGTLRLSHALFWPSALFRLAGCGFAAGASWVRR